MSEVRIRQNPSNVQSLSEVQTTIECFHRRNIKK